MLLEDLYCIDDLYYVGEIAPHIDGSPWVDRETAELILLEFNAGIQE
jgi:hypothetical protein